MTKESHNLNLDSRPYLNMHISLTNTNTEAIQRQAPRAEDYHGTEEEAHQEREVRQIQRADKVGAGDLGGVHVDVLPMRAREL